MPGSGFHDLAVYRLSIAVADDVYDAVMAWAPLPRWSLGIQLIRSADSIGANIAEAMGRWHIPDKRRLLFVARGSLYRPNTGSAGPKPAASSRQDRAGSSSSSPRPLAV
jgi:23S rRNA-intervening sequence protein